MACSRVTDVQPILPGEGVDGPGWSAKPLDHIPLRERRKLLNERKKRLDSSIPFSVECKNGLIPPAEVVVKEYEDCNSLDGPSPPSACSVRGVVKQFAQEQDPDGHDDKQFSPEARWSVTHAAVDQHSENDNCAQYGAVVRAGFNCQETQACPILQQVTCAAIQTDAGGPQKVNDKISSLPQCPKIDFLAPVKVEESEFLSSSAEKGIKGSHDADFHAPMVGKEISNGSVDDLDHIVLKERLRILLLARKNSGLSNPAFQGGSGELLEDTIKYSSERVNEEIHFANGKTIVARNECSNILAGSNASAFFESASSTMTGSSLPTEHESLKSIKPIGSLGLQESEKLMKCREIIMQGNCYEEQGVIPIKNGALCSSTLSTTVKVKDEPWDNSDFHNDKGDIVGDTSCNFFHVKSELEVHNKCHDDQVEHMCLRDRIRFLKSGENLKVDIHTSHAALKEIAPTALERSPIVSESVEPSSIKHPRKRKKTATDSVQTALEEDAPGLLQVLIDKGVMVDEIKLYGEMQGGEALDESFCEDSFADLEVVMSKLFSQRSSFIKFPLVRAASAKTSRANYCLACLVSLIEQVRYLRFRKWPADWGWCRDLQSFIFVFERHNRLVLERPEYGYATYFFELVESLPIDWQINRLVTAMKLTSCSRISLIENKALSIGEDLTEGEARVLMDYGWVPNSGLGTMLNYCDRVVHDRQNDKDSSEWRSKIGKLLADGYDGGVIVPSNIKFKFNL
ncbi:hypothetical protein L6164_030822 [Bauhinia variegata]|uniref:Uncharacterized protein n=1 Tax=Bauhinia variegata TaxID=167791 RepID=A0ACB9LDV0_BAUVA|nr:hypothetical protein L6164_030822 [Bauhinia variegata]